MSGETTELKLAANFEPATYEAWLALVAKVLKGSDFEVAAGLPHAGRYPHRAALYARRHAARHRDGATR